MGLIGDVQLPLPFLFFNTFIYLFSFWLRWVCCRVLAFSSCGERGLLFVAVHGLLIVVACLCCGAQAVGTQASIAAACVDFSSCGSRALERRLSSCGSQA